MRRLYHFALSPHCRKVRLALKEKALDFELAPIEPWAADPDFLVLNPAGEVPVLVEDDGTVLAESQAICEYLDEAYPDRPLIGFDPVHRAETRRLVAWFDLRFHADVTNYLVGEKVIKRLKGEGYPESAVIRAGQHNIRYHLDYVSFLSERRNWLAGEEFSLADIAASAQIACVDYLGAIPWDDFPLARDWYARIKSRPTFRSLLADQVRGLPPPKHYADLDF
ncbi:FtsZ-binding protein FzlA [Oceanibacterium hippocampi]|uniref:Glutathione S-transferase GST-6.0 n=1 Tax=Oceanibacterium hippocampi TaxID=745714 RepID=A0A1Y5RVB5_9PROT|nr:glutathione S-transferase family protein [Oceanibacterium hippocampi]SLN23478.1 Glutathione S-transferase GST-6.0 [Oceanibacterium hippocampi]